MLHIAKKSVFFFIFFQYGLQTCFSRLGAVGPSSESGERPRANFEGVGALWCKVAWIGLTCRNAEAEDPRSDKLLGDVTELEPSLLVSSRSIGDRGRSRLEAGLLFFPSSKALCGETAGLPEAATEAATEAADEAADKSCWRRLYSPWSIWGLGGLINPAIGNLNSVLQRLVLEVVLVVLRLAGLVEPVVGGGPTPPLPADAAPAAAATMSGRNICMYSKWPK